LYVAATRAAAQVIIGQPPQRARWEKLLAHVPPGARLPDPPRVAAPDVAAQTFAADTPKEFESFVRRRWQELSQRTWDVKRLKELVMSGGPGPRPGEHGTEWGSVIHVLLEAAMAATDLEALAASVLEEHDLDPARTDEALAMVQRVLGSDLWRRAQEASPCLTEVPIQYLEPGAGEGGVPTIVRGVIDLVFREAGGWVIVDYKTDDREASENDALVEHYAPQVRAYAEAWSRLTGEAVQEAGLLLVNTRRYREVPLADASAVGA
ncbi:MAG: PD-(D/E)XK nuclease family protein, partial [Gemmatimonadales bacterium]